MHSWDPVYFALLVSNSLFSATTSLLLLGAGLAVTRNPGIALCAALLYLLNFAVSDLQLAGLVDSGEACFMMLLTWALLRGRWWLLPLAGIGGALAKETFVAFALVFVIVWWWRSRPRPAVRSRESGYILALIVLGELTTIAIHFFTEGQLVTPWHIAATMNSHSNYLLAFFRSISDRSFWYVFGWLLPLGIWRWRCLPREWVSAALAAALVALAFGVYNDMGGTVARPIFDVAGPMLTLATVILVSGLVARLFSPTQIAANE